MFRAGVRKGLRRGEQGSALIIAVVIVLILAATSAALVTEAVYNYRRTKESRDYDEASRIANAGLERARRALNLYRRNTSWNPALGPDTYNPVVPPDQRSPQWNSLLQYNLQLSTTDRLFDVNSPTFLQRVRQNFDLMRKQAEFTAYLADPTAPGAAVLPEDPPSTDPAVIFGQNKPFRRGGYVVVIVDDNDDADQTTDRNNHVTAIVTATLEDGTQRQIQALLRYEPPDWIPDGALVTAGNMGINGASGFSVSGLDGDITTNSDLTFSGNPYIGGVSSASGTITGAPGPGSGVTQSGAEPVFIPEINPRDFIDRAHYLMTADGRIIDRSTNTELANLGGGGGSSWNGFRYNSTQGWSHSGGGAPPNDVYYVEANLSLSGSHVWSATFLVEASVQITGNVTMTSHPTMGDQVVIARGDLRISGNASGSGVVLDGFLAAHEQVDLGGNTTIYGSIVAENGDTVRNEVRGSESITAGGSVTVIHNGGLDTLIDIPTDVIVRQVRRIR